MSIRSQRPSGVEQDSSDVSMLMLKAVATLVNIQNCLRLQYSSSDMVVRKKQNGEAWDRDLAGSSVGYACSRFWLYIWRWPSRKSVFPSISIIIAVPCCSGLDIYRERRASRALTRRFGATGSDVKEEVPGRIAETGEEVCTWSLEEWGEPLAQDEKIKVQNPINPHNEESPKEKMHFIWTGLEGSGVCPPGKPCTGSRTPDGYWRIQSQYPERKELVFKEIPPSSKDAKVDIVRMEGEKEIKRLL
ncbi:hypothetical protein FB446DRAFT_706080 [Lentinula raphanica]|nr:hypothetical protein FB446DRAFT_706080 [Lentinula raphanica]